MQPLCCNTAVISSAYKVSVLRYVHPPALGQDYQSGRRIVNICRASRLRGSATLLLWGFPGSLLSGGSSAIEPVRITPLVARNMQDFDFQGRIQEQQERLMHFGVGLENTHSLISSVTCLLFYLLSFDQCGCLHFAPSAPFLYILPRLDFMRSLAFTAALTHYYIASHPLVPFFVEKNSLGGLLRTVPL